MTLTIVLNAWGHPTGEPNVDDDQSKERSRAPASPPPPRKRVVASMASGLEFKGLLHEGTQTARKAEFSGVCRKSSCRTGNRSGSLRMMRSEYDRNLRSAGIAGDHLQLLGRFSLANGVLVYPNAYGDDFSLLFDALAVHSNLCGVVSCAKARRSELWTDCQVLPGIADRLRALPVRWVIDHMGGFDVTAGVDADGFRCLLSLVGWIRERQVVRLSQLVEGK